MSADNDKDRRPSSEVLERYGRKAGSARKTKSGGLWRRISESMSAKTETAEHQHVSQGASVAADAESEPSPSGELPPVLSTEPTRQLRPSSDRRVHSESPLRLEQTESTQTSSDRRDPTDRDPAASPADTVVLELVLPNGHSIVLVGRTPVDRADGLLRLHVDPPPTNPATLVVALQRTLAAQTAEETSPALLPGATEQSPLPALSDDLQHEQPDAAGPLSKAHASAAQRDFQIMPETEKLRPDSEVLMPTTRAAPLTWGRSSPGRSSSTGTIRGARDEALQERRSTPRVRRGGAAARRSDPFPTGESLGPDPVEADARGRPPTGSRRTTPLRGPKTAQNARTGERSPSPPDDSSDNTEE